MKIPTTICLIALTFQLSAQNRYSTSLQLKAGLTGFEEKESSSMEWTTTTTTVIPGVNLSVGVNNNYFLTKKRWLSLSAGLLYNYTSFTRKQETETQVFPITIGPKTVEVDTRKFQSESFQHPIELHTYLWKFRFSTGMIFSYRRNAMYELSQTEYILGSSGEKINFAKEYYPEVKTGKTEEYLSQEFIPYIEKKIDLQYTYGLDFLITKKIRLGVTISDYFASNSLILESNNLGITSRPTLPDRYRNFDFTSKTIALNLNWEI